MNINWTNKCQPPTIVEHFVSPWNPPVSGCPNTVSHTCFITHSYLYIQQKNETVKLLKTDFWFDCCALTRGHIVGHNLHKLPSNSNLHFYAAFSGHKLLCHVYVASHTILTFLTSTRKPRASFVYVCIFTMYLYIFTFINIQSSSVLVISEVFLLNYIWNYYTYLKYCTWNKSVLISWLFLHRTDAPHNYLL